MIYTYHSCKVNGHQRVAGQEEVVQPHDVPEVRQDVPKPGDEPAERKDGPHLGTRSKEVQMLGSPQSHPFPLPGPSLSSVLCEESI